MSTFPKVLIISEFSFNRVSGGGILFTNLFEDFPVNNIALIHEDIEFEKHRIKFSLCIKKRMKFINKLYSYFNPFFKGKIKQIFRLLQKKEKINVITPEIRDLIESFKPDIIYSILGHNDLMELIKCVKEEYKLPLVTHIMDNFINTEETKNKKKVELFNYFIKNSSTLIAINKKMADVFSKKHLKKFEVIHNGLLRNKVKVIRNKAKSINIITYIGSIYENAQLKSIIKISEAIIALSSKGIKIRFDLYLPKQQLISFKSMFTKHECLNLRENTLNDTEYFNLLSESCLLILAANFDKDSIDYYKYSWPAKMPSYLMSGIPIFIFGPNDIYFISEAKKKSWGFVCNTNEQIILENSIKEILFDKRIKNNIVKYALKESKKFELEIIKRKFKQLLKKIKN